MPDPWAMVMNKEKNIKRTLSWKPVFAVVLAVTATALYFIIDRDNPRLALFLLAGIAFGFILSRSRFCFVSGFANFFIFRETAMLRAIIAGMFVATIGFTLVMYGWVADPFSGFIPPAAHVAPLGWYLPLGGLIFGLGMVLAGCCITGSLWRAAGGYIYALVALFGIILGMGGFLHTRFIWDEMIVTSPQVWLPAYLGWPGSVALVLILLIAAYFIITRFEPARNTDQGDQEASGKPSTAGLNLRFKNLLRKLFVDHWPFLAGGIILGGLNIISYYFLNRPLGVSGEFQRWAHIVFDLVRLTPPEVSAVPGT